MKNLFCFLLAGLLLTTACQPFSEEAAIQPRENTFREYIQAVADKLNSFTPSEQVFLESLHKQYPQVDQFLSLANEEEIHQLKQLGRLSILEEVSIRERNSFALLNQSLKAPESATVSPAYSKEIAEGFQAWTCKEWCVIRAEQSRLKSFSNCIAGKGNEHECRAEAEIRFFYFLTDCSGGC